MPALIVQDAGGVKPLGAVAVRLVVLLAPLSTTVNVLVAGPVVIVTVVVPVPTAPKPKFDVLLSVSPIAMPEVFLKEFSRCRALLQPHLSGCGPEELFDGVHDPRPQ